MDSARAEPPAERRLSPGTFWTMLEPAHHALVRQAGVVRRFEPGDSLCRQGESLRHVFVLLAGRVEVAADTQAGYEGVLAIRGPGDIVGELAAVDGSPRSATLRALDRVEVVVVSAETFALLCQSHPLLAWTVLRVVVNRLREISQWRVEQGGSTVVKRLVVLLIQLADQYGVAEEDGVAISVPLTQQSLARMIAASRESVVRALRDLRRQRLITTRRRHVTILRLEALVRLVS